MKNKILIIFLCINVIGLSVGCTTKKEESNINEFTTEEVVEDCGCDFEYNYEKFQGLYSMDWDFVDENYLMKIAEHKGGTIDDRAYTILVTLNRVWQHAFDENYIYYNEYCNSLIQDVVLKELYEIDGLTPEDFEGIIISEDTKEAIRQIKYGGFDNSNGSLEYK